MNGSEARHRIGIDVGGTFTDVFAFDGAAGRFEIAKVASTPGAPADGFMSGIDASGAPAGSIETIVHGTTVATNAILERKGAKCGLVATRGFRDALELGRRGVSSYPEVRPVIGSPRDVFDLVGAEMALLSQEHLRVLLLNTKNQVQGIPEIYIGNVNSSVVRVAEVLRPAIRENVPSIIVVHNHPSGDPTPSPEDMLITREIVAGGQMVGIDVLDHVVIGGNSHVSMKDKKLGFG